MIDPSHPLILASASPRRKALLMQVKIPFRVAPSDIDEDVGGGGPTEICRLAEKKARKVHGRTGPFWTLGADTVVIIDGQILGKPADEADARGMLSLLSGKTHSVITGFCVVDPSGRPVRSQAVTTSVQFKDLNALDIAAYIRTGEPFGKAGGYAIQGIGAFMVESISGSYTNVVGLPLYAVIQGLIEVGALAGFPLPTT